MEFIKTQLELPERPIKIVVRIVDENASTHYQYPKSLDEAKSIAWNAVNAGFLVNIDLDPAQAAVPAKFDAQFSATEARAILQALRMLANSPDTEKAEGDMLRGMIWQISQLMPAGEVK